MSRWKSSCMRHPIAYFSLIQERTYNPFYTLVAHHLCQKSHSHRVTLQYCLWDFLRSLGETQVGGTAISRDFADTADEVSDSTVANYAKAYAWWLARGSVALTILKVRRLQFSNSLC